MYHPQISPKLLSGRSVIKYLKPYVEVIFSLDAPLWLPHIFDYHFDNTFIAPPKAEWNKTFFSFHVCGVEDNLVIKRSSSY